MLLKNAVIQVIIEKKLPSCFFMKVDISINGTHQKVFWLKIKHVIINVGASKIGLEMIAMFLHTHISNIVFQNLHGMIYLCKLYISNNNIVVSCLHYLDI